MIRPPLSRLVVHPGAAAEPSAVAQRGTVASTTARAAATDLAGPPRRRRGVIALWSLSVVTACATLPTTQPPLATYDTGGADTAQGEAGVSDAQGNPPDTTAGDVNASDSTAGATDAADATAAADAKPEGTCQDRCNGPYNPGLPCQCNNDCPKFGNCCKDYGNLCDAAGNTCAGRCDAPADVSKPCQCTWDCAKHGHCCPDFIATCHAKEALDWFAAPTGKCTKETDWIGVKFIPDGDTIVLDQKDSAGEDITVRFLLVDTPEMTSKDCYAIDAKKFTVSAIQKSGKVCLVKESKSDDKDVYGRLLRYVFIKEPTQPQPVELNLRLLRLGLGRVLYPFAKGNPYEPLALLIQAKAKEDGMGGWKACGW